ncbi:MAG: hypothetical protein ABWZ77_01135 [Naasia sp.]
MQAAIDAASDGATIHICAGTYGRLDGGSVASINSRSLTLIGAGQGEDGTILDGGGSQNENPVITIIDAPTTVELRDLRITGASSRYAFGGGVGAYRSGLTLLRTTLTNNSASQGAGVYFSSPGKALSITDSTFSGNDAVGYGGGAIFLNDGTVQVSGTTVTQNSTAGAGGGLYMVGTLTLTDSVISRNAASYRGGGIYNVGTITFNTTQVTLNTSPWAAGVWNQGTVNVGSGSGITNNTVGNCVDDNAGTGCPPAWSQHGCRMP